MERDAAKWFGIETFEPGKAGERVTYNIPSDFVALTTEFSDLVGATQAKRLTSLFNLLKDLSRDGIEAIATLFAVWNDQIAAGQSPDDEAILHGVLNDWHPEKAMKFNRDSLTHWLAWMRRNQIIPDGTAPRTDHQRSLFQ
jgi:type I restriction enzyme S subunit